MSTDVRVEVTVDRPRAEVAAFMFEPENDPIWTTGVVSVRPLTEGRLRTGARVERTTRFLGRTFSYVYEVVDAEGDRFVAMTVAQPFPMQIRYELEDSEGATVARIHAKGDAGGFYRLAAPLLDAMVRRNIARDLENLRRHLESQRR